MPVKDLNPDGLQQDEDWEGNNAAFTCPVCQYQHCGVASTLLTGRCRLDIRVP